MKLDKTQEPQYNRLLELRDKKGITPLGLMTNQVWHDDPKRLVFTLARYKFVSKMLHGKKSVLEVGCGDGFGSRIVLAEVDRLTTIDFDPVFIQDIENRMEDKWRFDTRLHDILSGPVPGRFDAAYSLDLIEHIPRQSEEIFFSNISDSLENDGVLIIGTPSAQSEPYASPSSKEGHINLKTHTELKRLARKYFTNVFVFSMNDEVVHTGFYPMAHYLFALCVGKKGA